MNDIAKATLVNWLLNYGYQWVECGALYGTDYDYNLNWPNLEVMGYLDYDAEQDAERVTPKVYELLEEQSNGH